MERNFDLIRRILLAVEPNSKTEYDEVFFHIQLAEQSGYITLTGKGCEFLRKFRKDETWEDAKAICIQKELPICEFSMEAVWKRLNLDTCGFTNPRPEHENKNIERNT